MAAVSRVESVMLLSRIIPQGLTYSNRSIETTLATVARQDLP